VLDHRRWAGRQTPPWRDVADELNQTARRVPGRLGLRIMGALHQTAAASSHDATRRVHRILAPTLVVHGDEDELVPIGNARWLAERLRSAQLEVVRGGTHVLVLESSAARAVVKAWLDEHRHQPLLGPRAKDLPTSPRRPVEPSSARRSRSVASSGSGCGWCLVRAVSETAALKSPGSSDWDTFRPAT